MVGTVVLVLGTFVLLGVALGTTGVCVGVLVAFGVKVG